MNGSSCRPALWARSSRSTSQPHVAMDSGGDFVVTWLSISQSTNLNNVEARRYDATGAAVGDEFQVNPPNPRGQTNPAVAMDPAGDFVITWASDQSAATYNIY